MRTTVEAAARYLLSRKTPWRHRGRTETGLDCIGLVVFCLRCAGYEPKDRLNYGREPWKDGLRGELRRHCGPPLTSLEDARPGDIGLFQFTHMAEPSHVGLLATYRHGGLSVIHASSMYAVAEHGLKDVKFMKLVEVYPCPLDR